jgi:purine nucleosidase
MGGAVDVPGNVTPFAEFNTWNDPESAAEVLDGDIPVTLVPLDVCAPVRIASGDFEQAHPTARRLGLAWLRRHPGRRLGLADCVAIAAATHPAAFGFEQLAIDVDTSSGPERGRTRRGSRSERRIRVAMRVDADRVLDLIRTRALAPVPGAGGARGKR